MKWKSTLLKNVNIALSREGEKLGGVMKKFFELSGGKTPLCQWKVKPYQMQVKEEK